MGWILYQILKVIFLLVLPFSFLIRGAVYIHEHHFAYPWMAIAGASVATIILLFIYMTFLYGNFTGKVGNEEALKRRGLIAILLVVFYSVNGLLFISGANTKHEEVRKEFTKLHPILRLGISTILFLDKDLILTDAKRSPEDYARMGLKSKRYSLHYPQSDGYVHAVDIRTKGRSGVRNFLLKSYFTLMGFNTLRHGGTADHLHISLLSHDHPSGI